MTKQIGIDRARPPFGTVVCGYWYTAAIPMVHIKALTRAREIPEARRFN
jgi:hypothetical protein